MILLMTKNGPDSNTGNLIARIRSGVQARPLQQETCNVPETQGSAAFLQMSINDLLLSEGRTSMTELNPKRIGETTWFSYDPKITKSVLQMIKSDLPIFCPKYYVLPEDIKLRWFKSFSQEYNWNPTFTTLVRKRYDIVAKSLFTSQVYTWMKGWKKGKGPPEWWTKVDVWNGFITYWKGKKAKKIADKNKKNRNSERGGDGKAAHTTGSKSYVRRFDEMAQEFGHPPNMVDFMIETHKNKKTNTIIDKKTAQIAKSLKTKVDLMFSQETQDGSVHSNSLSQVQMDTLFLEEIKGTRFGIGSLSVGGSSFSFSDPAMQEELQIAKLKIAEIEKSQAEQAKAQAEQANAQAKQVKELKYFKTMFLKKFPNLSDFDPEIGDDN